MSIWKQRMSCSVARKLVLKAPSLNPQEQEEADNLLLRHLEGCNACRSFLEATDSDNRATEPEPNIPDTARELRRAMPSLSELELLIAAEAMQEGLLATRPRVISTGLQAGREGRNNRQVIANQPEERTLAVGDSEGAPGEERLSERRHHETPRMAAYWAELALSLLTFVSSVATLWAYFMGTRPVVATLGLIFFACGALWVARREQRLRAANRNMLIVIADREHDLSDGLRNQCYDLHRRYGTENLSKADIMRHAAATAQGFVDNVADVLSKLAEAEVCVSLKYFTPIEPGASVLDYYLSTLSRSSNSDKSRGNEPKIKVGDNSDYIQIVVECQPYFWAPNLKVHNNELKKSGTFYRNSTPNWQNYYAGTVIVPVRIQKKLLLDGDEDDMGFHMMGLLCADSLSARAFSEKLKPVFLILLKSFAHELYYYLDQVYFCLGETSGGCTPLADAGQATISPLFHHSVTIGTTDFHALNQKDSKKRE